MYQYLYILSLKLALLGQRLLDARSIRRLGASCGLDRVALAMAHGFRVALAHDDETELGEEFVFEGDLTGR